MLFGDTISAKFLERWPTAFKHKIVEQSKKLHQSPDLLDLISAAEKTSDGDDTGLNMFLLSCKIVNCVFCNKNRQN